MCITADWNQIIHEFMTAARDGDIDTVVRLHQREGYNLLMSRNEPASDCTALHIAAGAGQINVVEYLVHEGGMELINAVAFRNWDLF
jgi:hypothetical protein